VVLFLKKSEQESIAETLRGLLSAMGYEKDEHYSKLKADFSRHGFLGAYGVLFKSEQLAKVIVQS
jgi:hypothetical protein